LNFGCPHGMSERGMGAAMGQVPDYTCMVTEWVKEAASIPVIVKLTPNVTSINPPARAAVRGGADAVSLINTINSVMGVNLDTLVPHPNVNGLPFVSDINYTHSSDLRTMQEIFKLGGPFLGDAANATDLSALFAQGAIPTPEPTGFALVGTALVAFALVARRRTRN